MANHWFVGAKWNLQGDQTERFLQQAIWENGYEDRYREKICSIARGDRIAIKATYTRILSISNGQRVSTMSIKATGTVIENLLDGRKLRVEWEPEAPPYREWYFFVYQPTIWRVQPTDWKRRDLIAFAFDNGTQDMRRFADEYLPQG